MALSKADIFNRKDHRIEPVDVPEWGGTVHVRTLTAAERDAFDASTVKVGRNGKGEPCLDNLRGRLGVLVICTPEGDRIFEDADAGELGRKNAAALDRVLEVARRMNGMATDSVEDARGN